MNILMTIKYISVWLMKNCRLSYNRDKELPVNIQGIKNGGAHLEDNSNLIKEEQKKLDDIVKILDDRIIKNRKVIGDAKIEDINVYSKNDDVALNMAVKSNKEIESIRKKPYFGEISIKYDFDSQVASTYIGMKDVYDNNDLIISSWAAPIYDIYRRFESGKFVYEKTEKSGKKLNIQGKLLEKKQIDIEDDKVINVIQYGNYMSKIEENKFISKKIEESNTEKLGSIVETMQKEQNEIIRLPIEKNVLVQGCAGSGKSSVAFHRLAYLIYTYKLKEEEILVISPNKIFKNYTSKILTELGGEYEVTQFTFIELGKSIIKGYSKFFNNYILPKDTLLYKIKSSNKFKTVIDNYINYIEEHIVPDVSINLDEFVFIDYKEAIDVWKNRLSAYCINDRVEKFRDYYSRILEENLKNIIKFIEKDYEDKSEKMKKYDSLNKMSGLIIKEKLLKLERIRKQAVIIENYYFNLIKKCNLYEAYKKFIGNKQLLEELSKGILRDEEISLLKENADISKYNNIDLICSAYIYCRLYGVKNLYRHIVVDECQDLSSIEIAVIELISTSFTLVGDYNQQIDMYKKSASFNEVMDMFKHYTSFNKYTLNKSFRTTKSLTKYSNEILKPYFLEEKDIPIAFDRDSDKPVVIYGDNNQVIFKSIKNILLKEEFKNKNIGIITKTEEGAIEIHNYINKECRELNINIINKYNTAYNSGVNILSAELCKGLEFNIVIIPDVDEYKDYEYDRRLLYVCCTRALNQLIMYGKKEQCFVSSIDSNLYTIKREFKLIGAEEGMRNTILNVLSNNIKNVPIHFVEYLNSINELSLLVEIFTMLNTINDVDKIYDFMNSYKKTVKEEVKEQIPKQQNIQISNYLDEGGYQCELLKILKINVKKLKDQSWKICLYMIDHIDELYKINTTTELAKIVGVLPRNVTSTLIDMNLDSYPVLIRKLREERKINAENKRIINDNNADANIETNNKFKTNNDSYAKNKAFAIRKNKEFVRETILKNMYKLNDKQKRVAEFILNNIDRINEFDTINKLADEIGNVSSSIISACLMKMNFGTYTVFRSMFV